MAVADFECCLTTVVPAVQEHVQKVQAAFVEKIKASPCPDRSSLTLVESTRIMLPPSPFPIAIRPVRTLFEGMPQDAAGAWVLFVRHASKALGSSFLSLAENRARGLSSVGLEEAVALGQALVSPPHLILASPVVRARQTAEAIARGCAAAPVVLEEPALFGGVFHDHARWLDLKRELGWEPLVRRWLAGEVSPAIVSPPTDAVRGLLAVVRQRIAETSARRAIVVTQGYVNTAVFAYLHHVIDFNGGSLFGFVVPRSSLTQ